MRARGVGNEDLIDEHVQGVGHPGEGFDLAGDIAAGELGPLPPRFLLSAAYDEEALQVLLAYHAACCGPEGPHVRAGRDYALARDWTGPQQALALSGRNESEGPLCNLVVLAKAGEDMVGIIALAYHWDACVVQCIHVRPHARGPARLPEHLWARAKSELLARPRSTHCGDHAAWAQHHVHCDPARERAGWG